MPTLRYVLRYKVILVYTLEIPLIIRECLRELEIPLIIRECLRELEIPLIIRECLREPLTKSKLTEVILKSSMRNTHRWRICMQG